MSTDDQPNSIPCQIDAIRRYAAKHGMQVVATYSDPGRSGVELRHRPGLRRLLRDVTSGATTFQRILVYDVSRWGRFQDCDEAAHYEFICRASGIPIHYCAEQFENDGTAQSAIMKALKRTMAAEYSRELSVKISAVQRRIAAKGFRMGGLPGFGLRRMLLYPDGRPRRLLQTGERKAAITDRVILVPGPKREVECLKTIFAMATERRNTPSRIAEELNRRGKKFGNGRKWTEESIYRILKNEKYMGVQVWGKRGGAFASHRTRPPEEWIIKPDAFMPVINPRLFARVQKVILKRKTWPSISDAVFIERMRKVLVREGRLTEALLRKHHVYSFRRMITRFGSVFGAYNLIGYQPPNNLAKRVKVWKRLRQLRSEVFQRLCEMFPYQVSRVQLPGQVQRHVIELEHQLLIGVHVCLPEKASVYGYSRWTLVLHPGETLFPILVCLPSSSLDEIETYYVLAPLPGTREKGRILIGADHPWLVGGKRLKSLSQFCLAVKEVMANWVPHEEVSTVADAFFTSRTSTVSVAGRDIHLSLIQQTMFKLLAINAGHVVSREDLARAGLAVARHLSGRLLDPTKQFVQSHVNEMRRKLGPLRERIVSVRGQGYMYRPWGSPGTGKFNEMLLKD